MDIRGPPAQCPPAQCPPAQCPPARAAGRHEPPDPGRSGAV